MKGKSKPSVMVSPPYGQGNSWSSGTLFLLSEIHQRFRHYRCPLHELTHKNVKFQWGVDCQNAFAQLKTALITAPILALPIDDDNYVIDTDASGLSIGAVLCQEQEGQEKVIACASKLLNPAE